jgi:hypothetical protein
MSFESAYHAFREKIVPWTPPLYRGVAFLLMCQCALVAVHDAPPTRTTLSQVISISILFSFDDSDYRSA